MKLLAFDTSADAMSIAVSRDDGAAPGLWQLQGEGGAKASATLIGNILDLLKKADLALSQLDAICFGAGPGYFTGLRTACAVAQGLAFGANVPVLPVPSLLALAEEARFSAMPQASHLRLCAMLDARMDEIYLQQFDYVHGNWTSTYSAALLRPQDLRLTPSLPSPAAALVAAGNVFAVYASCLDGIAPEVQRIHALPQATAMLRLAPQLLAAGQAVAAEQALPSYVRNKVAQTSAERATLKAAQADAPRPVASAS